MVAWNAGLYLLLYLGRKLEVCSSDTAIRATMLMPRHRNILIRYLSTTRGLRPLPLIELEAVARTRSTVDYNWPLEYPKMGSWRRREEGT